MRRCGFFPTPPRLLGHSSLYHPLLPFPSLGILCRKNGKTERDTRSKPVPQVPRDLQLTASLPRFPRTPPPLARSFPPPTPAARNGLSDYAGFCERTFGGERLDQGVPHREIDPSQPVLYENTVGAYEHFFGACPPAEFWPKVPTAAAGPALDGEETGGADFSGRRKAFVRSAEEHFRFSEE